MFDLLGKLSGNCCQGGGCWVVTTHLVVTFVWEEVSQVFDFPYAWKRLRISHLNEEAREEILETCINLSTDQ
jgi:hypothetical protein